MGWIFPIALDNFPLYDIMIKEDIAARGWAIKQALSPQKNQKKEDRMQQNQTLPAYLTERLTAVYGEQAPEIIAGMVKKKTAFRVNTLKADREEVL